MPDLHSGDNVPATDYFALLGEPRRPWLDPAPLQARFHRLAADAHPDRTHAAGEEDKAAANARFAALNAAHGCLRDPKGRLSHLLLLEWGQKPPDVQRIPPGTIELFTEVGTACHEVDAALAGRDQETSPMRRLRFVERGLEWSDRMESLRKDIQARQEALMRELREMNAFWESAPPPGDPARRTSLPLRRLAELSQLFSYLARWSSQLEERLTRLAL